MVKEQSVVQRTHGLINLSDIGMKSGLPRLEYGMNH